MSASRPNPHTSGRCSLEWPPRGVWTRNAGRQGCQKHLVCMLLELYSKPGVLFCSLEHSQWGQVLITWEGAWGSKVAVSPGNWVMAHRAVRLWCDVGHAAGPQTGVLKTGQKPSCAFQRWLHEREQHSSVFPGPCSRQKVYNNVIQNTG